MAVARLINRPCSIVHRTDSGEVDGDGNTVYDEETIETVCELQQRDRAENPEGISDTLWDLFLLAGTPTGPRDTITIDAEYEYVGEAWVVYDPFRRRASHIEATARRTNGAPEGGS